jgi:hypothetical protein
MNTETKSTRHTENELVRSLVDLGTEWAVLGLSFGTQALERSAKSIALAAKTLDTISRTLEKKPEPQAEEVHPVEVVAEGVDVTDEPRGS